MPGGHPSLQGFAIRVDTCLPRLASVLDCVQSVINHAPLQRLGYRTQGILRTPLEVFTGIKAVRPLLRDLPIQRYKSKFKGRWSSGEAIDQYRAGPKCSIGNLHRCRWPEHCVSRTTSTTTQWKDKYTTHKFLFGWFCSGPMRTEKRAQIAIILACTSPHFQSHQLSGFWSWGSNSSKKEIVHARRICFLPGKVRWRTG